MHPEGDEVMKNMCVYFIGTAGCGKSTMTAGFAEWLELRSLSSYIVNLDPGVLTLPYEPDFDIRDFITLTDVMEEHGLGPNGAQVVCSDMLALHLPSISSSIRNTEASYTLVDTPGQLELFSFREASRELVRGLFPDRSILVYLIDPFNTHTASGLISQLMLSALSRLRFSIPSLEVISKADMIDKEIESRMEYWKGYTDNILDDLITESRTMGTVDRDLAVNLFRVIEEMGLFSSLMPISSTTGEGMNAIYEMVQMTFSGGEDPAHDG